MAAPEETVYRLDASDRIVWVGPGWDTFAIENDAPELVRNAVVGRPIWDFIAGEEVRYLHRRLLERVRDERCVFDLPFRCDAPGTRRHMHMAIILLPTGGVEYRCRVEHAEFREAVELLRAGGVRKGRALPICSWCRRVHLGADEWVEVEEAIVRLGLFDLQQPPPFIHTVCPRDQRLVGL